MKIFNRIASVIVSVLIMTSCLPEAPKYPHEDPAKVIDEGKKISADLEQYIKDWLDGKVSANIHFTIPFRNLMLPTFC